jgi:cysteine sulfinate desulfinase/cysteine desulfurase-like protein
VRFSLGRGSSTEEIDRAVEIVVETVVQLLRLSPTHHAVARRPG